MDRRIRIRISTNVSWIRNTGAEGKPGCGKVRWPEVWDSVWPGTDRCGRSASCRTAGSAAQCYCSAGQTWTAQSLPLPVHKKNIRTFSLFLIQRVIRKKIMSDPDPGTSAPGPKWIWNKTSKNYLLWEASQAAIRKPAQDPWRELLKGFSQLVPMWFQRRKQKLSFGVSSQKDSH